jgi:hypothetical protein
MATGWIAESTKNLPPPCFGSIELFLAQERGNMLTVHGHQCSARTS